MRLVKSLLFMFIVSVHHLAAAALFDGKPEWSQLTFSYPQGQLDAVEGVPQPNKRIDNDELMKLNREVSYLLNTTELTGIEATVIPPYLANAQKDFAWLSYLLTGEFKGSLGPVTLWTLQLFIPEAELPGVKEKDFDLFSSTLASLVACRVSGRWNREQQQISDYPVKQGERVWKPTGKGYRGINYGTMQTWYLKSSDEFAAERPVQNQEFWKSECDEIKTAQIEASGKEVQSVFEWAGLTAPDAGSWEEILNNYLVQKNISLAERLYVRAVFLSALADSNAAAFHSKYTYWIMRPSQLDPAVRPLIVVPNHPSYPSAHSTISATAAKVLSRLFPAEKGNWDRLAEEAGMSRIWGGIHYPADHQVGLKLGDEVGDAVLNRLPGKKR